MTIRLRTAALYTATAFSAVAVVNAYTEIRHGTPAIPTPLAPITRLAAATAWLVAAIEHGRERTLANLAAAEARLINHIDSWGVDAFLAADPTPEHAPTPAQSTQRQPRPGPARISSVP